MELYIIHRKATWEVSVKTPFRHLKVENNIPPAKTLSCAAFPARTWSCPWLFCEWMCFSTPGKHSPWPFGAALSDSSRCGITGKVCPEGGKDGSSQSSWECPGFLQHNLPLEFPATLVPEPDPLPTSVSRVWTPSQSKISFLPSWLLVCRLYLGIPFCQDLRPVLAISKCHFPPKPQRTWPLLPVLWNQNPLPKIL